MRWIGSWAVDAFYPMHGGFDALESPREGRAAESAALAESQDGCRRWDILLRGIAAAFPLKLMGQSGGCVSTKNRLMAVLVQATVTALLAGGAASPWRNPADIRTPRRAPTTPRLT